MTLNLQKKSQLDLTKAVEITLEKKSLLSVQANVVMAIDVSGSMDHLFRSGQVQLAVERLIPLAGKWDSDGKVDVFTFNNGVRSGGQVGTTGYDNWVANNIQSHLGGGTNYAPVINEIVKRYGNKQGGFMGFGAKTAPAEIPTYVLFMTDGDNWDKDDAVKAITEASKHGIFFQFVGLGNQRFEMLRTLDDLQGRYIDNANFFELSGSVTDEQLYELMLTEFPSWLTEAKAKNLIK